MLLFLYSKKLKKYFLLKILFFVSSCFLLHGVWGQEIRFPKEELARESVFPVFENNKKLVMNRNMTIKYRLDIHGSALFRGDEPFYFRLFLFPGMAFYFNEVHGVSLSGGYFWPGRSTVGERLLAVPSQDENVETVRYDATLVPHPLSVFFVNYVFVPFYGKFSFSKKIVKNFNFSLSLGLGAIQLMQRSCSLCGSSDLKNTLWRPALWLGVKQKLFLNRNFYIYGKFGFMSYYGPNPVNAQVLNQLQAPSLQTVTDPHIFYFSDQSKEILIFRNVIGVGMGLFLF